MRKYRATCDECGFDRTYDTRSLAKQRLKVHGCEFFQRLAAIDRTPKPCLHPRANHQHGTTVAYTRDDCRCWPCSEAAAEYERRRVRRRAYGRWQPYVDAEPARLHVKELLAGGMTVPQVARAAGVNPTQVRNLVVGHPRYGPAKQLRPETAEAVLAVTLVRGPVGDSGWLDATGTRRRIEALNVIGYHDSYLARRIGMSPTNFATFRRRKTIRAKTALAVRELYERLKDTEGPAMHAKGNYPKFVTRCRQKGYLPPIWWDDDLIDDPDYDPRVLEDGLDEVAILRAMDGDEVTITRAERDEALRRLHAQYLTDRQIAERLHVTSRTVLRDRQRLGLPAAVDDQGNPIVRTTTKEQEKAA